MRRRRPDRVLESCRWSRGSASPRPTGQAAKDRLAKRLRERGYAKAEGRRTGAGRREDAPGGADHLVHPGLRIASARSSVTARPGAPHPAGFVWEQVRAGDRRRRRLQRRRAARRPQRRVFGMGVFSSARVVAGDARRRHAAHRRCGSRCARRRSARCASGGGVRIDQIRNEARLHRRVDQPQLPGRHAQADPARRGGLGLHPRTPTRSTREPSSPRRRATDRSARAAARRSSSRASSVARRCAR